MKSSRFFSLVTLFGLLSVPSLLSGASLTFNSRTQVSENNANFDISVFPGTASYNDRGIGGVEPGVPTLTNPLGDGTVLSYNFVGNDGNGSELTTYASDGARTPTPVRVGATASTHGGGEDWANVWTVSDPGVDFVNVKDHNPTNTVGAANTFARVAEADGLIDISGMTEGQIYFPVGSFNNGWSLTLTMQGAGQDDIQVADSEGGIGNFNRGYISAFDFTNEGQYTSIKYEWRHGDLDGSPGSRARFMGVILDGVVDLDFDSDGDLLDDLWEDEFFGNNNGTVEPSDLTVTDGTGDADADGATDRQEYDATSNPNVKDTDSDGLEDGPELNTHGSDPTLEDTDSDNLNDFDEVTVHMTNPANPDTDGDNLTDDEELVAGADTFVTDPTLADTDDDGVRDDIDVDPNDPDSDNDNDDLGNRDERDVHGTDPLDDDSDDDGILDGEEVVEGDDGFITSPLEQDTDSDGFSDGAEIAAGSDPTDENSLPSGVSTIGLVDRVQVSTNNANFDISVFPGAAGYNDRGIGGSEPGEPTFSNPFGDGTVLDYNFVGNEGTGSPLTTYASGEAGLIPTPTAPSANVHGNGEDWANVWTVSDPGADFAANPKDHNPTNTIGAANTFARAAEVDGTIDITGIREGTLYFPHGTFINAWTLTVTMSGEGLPDIVALDTEVNGASTNFGWITSFTFVNKDGYDTISYNYTNGDRDGSRARFMGVILAADADSTPLVITDVIHNDTGDNILVDLVFRSSEGRLYTILASNDLSLPVESWTQLEDEFEGEAGESSTYTANFNLQGLPLDDKFYFIILKN
ncbi:MAG: hypothetical protein ACON5N_13985 [Akkermansiaceae bacterium]